ncbi:n-carbamyl-d-amino acid amidohydrolase [Grosmannia clavigera kw1407]|uniref:N-carbamyl-d-amino acid amidohydrolase n=1 Tax=Grosmannia clavigera (strain kw1407 / UAMH 11150) TaxID=655863 RepID=F0XH31_GROCL|nr:n-carbamyl-d-amino acid amidohydrolase [Grosmannia clavigera kw1407]EFX03078.1 n-carbamyl-d-amino acid amidohydrolase [Grosmannia clavigera kw1407]
MARQFRIAAAQMGSTHYADAREKTLGRMLALLDDAVAKGAQVVLFPETAFGTFFPRHLITDEAELDSFFEHGDVVTQRYNACIFYDGRSGATLSKYRKIHLPGDVEPWADPTALNQLEKRDHSDPIFGMMICNDRRWAESWRVLGLQGVDVVLVGYNTPGFAPHLYGGSAAEATTEERARATEQALFQHRLVMQAHSYTNACFSVCAARAGLDDGRYDLIAGSCIVGPEGNILAEATTDGDEVVVADIDLDACPPGPPAHL